MDVVKENWRVDFVGDSFTEFYAKLKCIKKALVLWSREAFGDIFQKVATLEDEVNIKEVQFEMNPSEANREDLNRVNVELKKYWHLKEEFWRQKASMRWFVDGDRNTKFFHAYINGKRRRLRIDEIITMEGDVI